MFSFLSISDSKALWPIAITAVVGIGIYYLWRTSQQAADNQTNAATPAASVGNAGTLALLAAMFGNGQGQGQGQTQSGSMATVTPGGAANAPGQHAPVGGSSVVPSIVTQGL